MKKGLFFYLATLLFLIHCAVSTQAQVDFRWAKQFGGTGIDQGRAVVTGPDGSIYFTGNFGGTASFAQASGTISLTNFGSGEDIYVAKADSNGNVIWARQMGGTEHDRGACITLDNQGNLYVGGYFTKTASFGSGLTLQAGGYSDGFLMQLDTSGQINWVRQLKGNVGNDHILDVTTDRQNNVIVVGIFLDSADIGTPAAPYIIRSGAATYNTYIGKYDDQGDLIWAKTFGTQQYSSVSAISVTTDHDNNLYLAGAFSGTIDFDPGTGYFPLTGGYDYIAKLTSSGDFVWAKQMEASSGMTGGMNAIHVDTLTNSLYVCGSFEGRVDFDPAPARHWLNAKGYTEDGFILKLDTAGSFQWVRQLEAWYGINTRDITTDRFGRLYICGYFMETADLDPGTDSFLVLSNGGFDSYLLSLDPAGQFLWGRSFGGNQNECVFTMSVTEEFTINSTGLFAGNADFHIDRDTYAFVNSAGNHDIFLHQISVFSCRSHDVIINVDKDTLSITQDFVSYRWLFNGDTIPGATGKSHIAAENGYYAVAFVDESGCADTSQTYHVNNLSIQNGTTYAPIQVYPNPAEDYIYISGATAPLRLTLKDINGRIIMISTDNRLQTSDLPGGLYFLQIAVPGKSPVTVKLLKK